MSLRIEEDLGMTDIVLCRMMEIFHGQIIEIVFRLQYVHGRIIDSQEGCQIIVLIRSAYFFNRSLADIHMILLSQLQFQFRFQRTFDVQMQLCFRHAHDKFFRDFCSHC